MPWFFTLFIHSTQLPFSYICFIFNFLPVFTSIFISIIFFPLFDMPTKSMNFLVRGVSCRENGSENLIKMTKAENKGLTRFNCFDVCVFGCDRTVYNNALLHAYVNIHTASHHQTTGIFQTRIFRTDGPASENFTLTRCPFANLNKCREN